MSLIYGPICRKGTNSSGPIFLAQDLAAQALIQEVTGCDCWEPGELNLADAASMLGALPRACGIIVVSDSLSRTSGLADKAAKAALGRVFVPRRASGEACDLAELFHLEGMDIVRTQLAKAVTLAQTSQEQPESQPGKLSLQVVNVAELLAMDLPERGHILYPVIPEQGLAMLYAPRGLGKTWAALSIAYAVATGQRTIGGWTAEKPRRVLYLDGEMPARTMKERLGLIAAGCMAKPPDPDYLRILTPDLQPNSMPNIATLEGQANLTTILEGVDFVVVDNIATLGRHGRENESESWTPVQGWLLSLRRAGKSVLLVHHSGKNGEQRGTSAREDILDTVIALKRPEDYQAEEGARFEVHLEKARGLCGAEAKPFETTLNIDNGLATWFTRQLEDAENARILALQLDGLSSREIAKEIGKHHSTICRRLKSLGVKGAEK